MTQHPDPTVEPATLSDAPETDGDGNNTLTRPHASMYQYPRKKPALMWFEYIVGAALVIGGIVVAVRQFGQLAAGGGIGDIVGGIIGIVLVVIGLLLLREGYRDRPVDL